MAEPILDPEYWKKRLKAADHVHHAVFKCPLDRWLRIERKHKEIIAATIGPADSVLDVGCGWGRLLSLMPKDWYGDYVGVDLSPDFVEMAKREHPLRQFVCQDVLGTHRYDAVFDWAVLISFRPMVKRNLGAEEWKTRECAIRAVARRLLYLEYDEYDVGSVE